MTKLQGLSAIKTHFQKIIREDLGLARFTEEDGDFLFHYEKVRMAVCFDAADPAYVRVHALGIYWVKASDQDAMGRVDSGMNQINHDNKLVKVFRRPKVDKDGEYGVDATIEIVVEEAMLPGAGTFERYLAALKVAGREFREDFERGEAEIVPPPAIEEVPATPVRH